MLSEPQRSTPTFVEFVVIVSLMMSIPALSIDAMLPALPQIGLDLGVKNANDRQLIVSSILLGLAVGQLLFGPLSDRTGRKPAISLGFALYFVGAFVCILAANFPIMLWGRLLQGIGISAPRAVTLAIVRDRYEGRGMARVMSFVMTVFILVPMIAPSLGQMLMVNFGWRSIFASFVLIAFISLAWYGLRIPETLTPEDRIPFSPRRIFHATIEIVKIRPAVGYTISAGLIGGAFLGYLNSAQQIFQEQYAFGARFPLIFSVISLSLGLASFMNAHFVMRYGMRFLVRWSLRIILILSIIGGGIGMIAAGQPPIWFLMAYLMLTFFCIGILFGNQNSLAMQPLGHLAGIGAAVVGSLSTLIQIPLGTLIGRSYNGTILPLIFGITILTGLAMSVVRWTESE